MLIRLCGHFIDNPSHIDKLICIKGLPEAFFFRWNEKYEGNELIKPWEPDVEANIPESIRHLCDSFEVIKVFPPIEKGREYIVDRKRCLGLRFDYMTEAGQTMWDKIENYLERSVSRDQSIPKPCIVAPNQKDGFNPHECRRSVRGSLELRPCEIPVVDLRKTLEPEVIVKPEPVTTGNTGTVEVIKVDLESVPVKKSGNGLECGECGKKFDKPRQLSMHKVGAHRKQKVGA